MFVTFSWPVMPRALNKSAESIAQAIKDSKRLEDLLKPLASVQGLDPVLGNCEVLQMEIGGLCNNFYLMPIWGVYNVSMWQRVEDVVDLLRELVGIEPQVLINGNQTVLSYAAQEEARARYFRDTLESARDALKATRNFFRDHRIAAIRQAIDTCFELESQVDFVGYRRVLVEEKKP